MLKGIFRKCSKLYLPGDGLRYIRLKPAMRQESIYAIGPKESCKRICADLDAQTRVAPLHPGKDIWGLFVSRGENE